jgi:hypothetical protein
VKVSFNKSSNLANLWLSLSSAIRALMQLIAALIQRKWFSSRLIAPRVPQLKTGQIAGVKLDYLEAKLCPVERLHMDVGR